ncbi:solute carrier family 22 member 20-like [Pelobates cultripes]|uniref:Solute carrier family 22 member 20-like n=1 Tax=Pelobates cultripes TaxID=61616 RepID=A0AAD1THN5_PELCU|nr:solute carrier family 22 member 20-like [Pelobates cultripes]
MAVRPEVTRQTIHGKSFLSLDTMTFADLLDRIGGVGTFQILHSILLAFPVCMVACHNFLQNFTAAFPAHHCKQKLGLNISGNISYEDLMRVTIPLNQKGLPERCRRFSEPQWMMLNPNVTLANISDAETESCLDGWVYDTSVVRSSIITEWDLVCDLSSMRQMAQSVYMVGVLLGGAVFGGIADRFGRRTVLIWSYMQMSIAGTLVAFLPSFPCYVFFRLISGMTFSSVLLNTLCLMLEWMPVKGRTLAGTFIGYVFTSGQMVLSGLAYAIRDWRWLQFSVTAPFYFFFVYSWLLQESGRWLILNGRTDQALTNMRRVARLNGKEDEGLKMSKEEVIAEMQNEISNRKSSHSLLDLIRTPGMRRITGCLMMVWFSTSFAYYGLAMDLQKFGISIYLVQFCFGAIDIPAKLVAALTMTFVGRRMTQGLFLILAGTMIIANIFVPVDMQVLRTALAALGKGCCASAFMCAYLYSGELFPTEIRQTGMGFSDMNARVGSVVAPVIHLIGEYIPILPAVIFGAAPIVSGIAATCLLPETRNRPLSDTIQEVEDRRKKRNWKQDVELKLEIVPLTQKPENCFKDAI